MTSAGQWICRSCNAHAQAAAATNFVRATEDHRRARLPFLVVGGVLTLGLIAVLSFLYWFMQGFAHAL